MDWHKKPVVLTADVDLEKGLRRDSVESLEDDDTDEAHIMKATPEDETETVPSDAKASKSPLRERFKQGTRGGVKDRHLRRVVLLGRVGWVAKGVVYALIGGMCCRGAVDTSVTENASAK
mmetsp:Transcript_16240/g.48647  ORF Transcript_16240/g.48647 Transcript_16240/m.48647 type:complete len:120 (-) Transcript_16240:1145-1504(-)